MKSTKNFIISSNIYNINSESLISMLRESVLNVIEANPVLGQCSKIVGTWNYFRRAIKFLGSESSLNTDNFFSEGSRDFLKLMKLGSY